MRSTLLGSALLVLTFGAVGCDDGMKKTDTAEPAVIQTPAPTPVPGDAPKATMEGPGAAMEGPGGAAMGGPAPVVSDTPTPVSPEPAAEPKKEEMPK